MIKTNENRKDNVIAWCTTVGTMALLLILLLACSLKTQIPPPPPKQMVYVDIEPAGGGGGGGTPDVASNPKPSTGQNYATQNAQDAPAVTHSNRTSTNAQTQAPSTPKPDQSSMYHGRGGRGIMIRVITMKEATTPDFLTRKEPGMVHRFLMA